MSPLLYRNAIKNVLPLEEDRSIIGYLSILFNSTFESFYNIVALAAINFKIVYHFAANKKPGLHSSRNSTHIAAYRIDLL